MHPPGLQAFRYTRRFMVASAERDELLEIEEDRAVSVMAHTMVDNRCWLNGFRFEAHFTQRLSRDLSTPKPPPLWRLVQSPGKDELWSELIHLRVPPAALPPSL